MIKLQAVFLAIILFASILRLWKLDQFPAGFNADEASIGYNAYSLMHSGKDEYGSSWPLAFKSFGDYKPGLYFYFVMPFVAVLGLNEWAIRLPSAFFGIGTVILIYFLANEIFKDKKAGLLAGLLLAISPWHLQFSRGGWETNVATFFMTLGILLFLKGLKKHQLLWGSGLSGLISMYVYQSPRLIVPVLVLVLIFLYRQDCSLIIRTIKLKKIAVSILILICLSVPLLMQFTSGGGNARFSGLSFLSDTGPASRVNELRGQHNNPGGIVVAQIIHNKLTAYGPSFLGHYLDHFRGDFLFINGDPIIRNRVPETGELYIIEAIFLISGLIILTRGKFEHTKLLLAWILVAPLASSITFQTPHALRALSMVIPLTLICSLGLSGLIDWLGKAGKLWKGLATGAVVIILTFEFIHYLESYYVHYPKRYPLAWEYGFKEMVQKLGQYEAHYNNVVITDRYDQPYILVLFYKKYDPAKYQPQAVLSPRDKFNFGTIRGFDKYQFHSVKPEEFKSNKTTLFVATEDEVPKTMKIIDKVNFPNGQPAFLFVEGGQI